MSSLVIDFIYSLRTKCWNLAYWASIIINFCNLISSCLGPFSVPILDNDHLLMMTIMIEDNPFFRNRPKTANAQSILLIEQLFLLLGKTR